MIISNLKDFLFAIEPAIGAISVKHAMRKTGLSEYKCRKYLNEATSKGLYDKKSDSSSQHNSAANRFSKRFVYQKINSTP